jgi:phosphatidylinositol alpha-1,6-mannosyltransferase
MYMIVGEGDDRPRLQRLARALGLDGHVTFTGHVSDDLLPSVYAAADVFVMVSREANGGRTEGFGIAYLEAAAAGKPVVYAESGGACEAAVDGHTGLRTDPHHAQAVAASIAQLLADPAEARRLGQNGQARAAERFSWEHSAATYRGLLDSLLARQTQP